MFSLKPSEEVDKNLLTYWDWQKWRLNDKKGQWNEVLYQNWNIVISNTFGYSIETQHPKETIFNLEVKLQ